MKYYLKINPWYINISKCLLNIQSKSKYSIYTCTGSSDIGKDSLATLNVIKYIKKHENINPFPDCIIKVYEI